MNLGKFVLIVFYHFTVPAKAADLCRCLLKRDCFDSPDFIENICIGGCKPGWEGLFCDRPTNGQTPCHCVPKFDCELGFCTSCEHGWYGFNCDRQRKYIITTPTAENSSRKGKGKWNYWNIAGYSMLGIVVCFIIFCCVFRGARHKNRGEEAETSATRREPMWSTGSSASFNIQNRPRNTSYSAYNTDTMHRLSVQSVPLELSSGNEAFMEPPPSYESIMSQDNIRIDTKTTQDL